MLGDVKPTVNSCIAHPKHRRFETAEAARGLQATDALNRTSGVETDGDPRTSTMRPICSLTSADPSIMECEVASMPEPAKKTVLQNIALVVSIFVLALLGSSLEQPSVSSRGLAGQSVVVIGNCHHFSTLRRTSGGRTPATVVDDHRGRDGRSTPSDDTATGLDCNRWDIGTKHRTYRIVDGHVLTTWQLPNRVSALDAPRARAPPRSVA